MSGAFRADRATDQLKPWGCALWSGCFRGSRGVEFGQWFLCSPDPSRRALALPSSAMQQCCEVDW
eukprot:11225882-Lingulodinium_polyedra.AAC.1